MYVIHDPSFLHGAQVAVFLSQCDSGAAKQSIISPHRITAMILPVDTKDKSLFKSWECEAVCCSEWIEDKSPNLYFKKKKKKREKGLR